jgi:hypothetical protein
MMTRKRVKTGESIGLIIPIGVLIIVMIATGVIWLLIPIFVLGIVLLSSIGVEGSLQRQEREYLSSEGVYVSGSDDAIPHLDRPIYDQQKRKDEGVAVGLLIPIGIMAILYFSTGSWPFLIPLFVLVLVLIGSFGAESQSRSTVMDVIETEDVRDLQDIADRTGIPEEDVRRYIVREKRSGTSDIWFDGETGSRADRPVAMEDVSASHPLGCPYCGFALKSEDRFCPFCGAPIRAG